MFSLNVVCEELLLRSLRASPFINPFFFHAWSVTGREIRVLKCLSRLKVRVRVDAKY